MLVTANYKMSFDLLRRELAGLDLDGLRPLDALNLLSDWKKRLG